MQHTQSNDSTAPRILINNSTKTEITDDCITTEQLELEETNDLTLEHFCESHGTTKSLCKEFLSLTLILDSKFIIKFEKKKDESENEHILILFISIKQVLQSDDFEYLSTTYKTIAFSSSDNTMVNCELTDN